jgi:hypothetical protein
LRRFFARFKKQLYFQRSNLPDRRLPACNEREKREHLLSKNPVAIAPGSDHENAGRWRPTTICEARTSRPPSAFRRYHERELRRDGHFLDETGFA